MKDLRFVIFAVLGLAAAWFLMGGPERAKTDGIFLSPPPPFGTGESYGVLRGSFFTGFPKGGSLGDGIRDAGTELEKIRSDIGDAALFGEISPHKGKVRIERSTAGIRETDPAREYVALDAASGNTAPVTVTGWKLVNEDGTVGAIGNGFSLPRTGVVDTAGPITLQPGSRAYVATGRAPTGSSFCTNVCTGYFEQFQDFTPRLREACPIPSQEIERAPDYRDFDDACVSFVKSMTQCRIHMGETPTIFKDACYQFLTTALTYEGCVARHQTDQDFYGNEWRIFLARDGELWEKERGVVRLTDENGKTVDLYVY